MYPFCTGLSISFLSFLVICRLSPPPHIGEGLNYLVNDSFYGVCEQILTGSCDQDDSITLVRGSGLNKRSTESQEQKKQLEQSL